MRVRAFTWNDLATYARLLRESAVVDGGNVSFSEKDAGEVLRQPNLHPERDCFIAEVEGEAAGVILVIPESDIGRTVLEGAVPPNFRRRGVGTLLIETAVEHSRGLGVAVVHASATPEAMGARRLLAKAGFAEARRQWRMRLELADLVRGEPVTGYDVRHMHAGEEAVMTELQNKAFTGSFGFAPNIPEEIAYRTRMGGARPEDTLFVHADGKPVAYCWTRRPAPGATDAAGIVWMIGADPEARGRGFGRAMLLESVDYLASEGAEAVELTVYQDNTPAVALYRATRFHETGEIIWYARRLSP